METQVTKTGRHEFEVLMELKFISDAIPRQVSTNEHHIFSKKEIEKGKML